MKSENGEELIQVTENSGKSKAKRKMLKVVD